MPRMPAISGRMRHVLKIQAASDSRTLDGRTVTTWTTKATVRGSVEPLRGREYWEANQVKSSASHSVFIRHWPGLTSQYRIMFGSRALQIVSIQQTDAVGRFMDVICMEVNDG